MTLTKFARMALRSVGLELAGDRTGRGYLALFEDDELDAIAKSCRDEIEKRTAHREKSKKAAEGGPFILCDQCGFPNPVVDSHGRPFVPFSRSMSGPQVVAADNTDPPLVQS